MAEKKWKLGELEFDSEQEYLDASRDLKKIKSIMEKHDITKPAEAKAVLKEVTDKPVFVSSYGLKFVEKLEKTVAGANAAESGSASTADKAADKTAKKQKKEKKVHIITKRNILIGTVIIAVLVAAKFVIPLVMPGLAVQESGEKENIHRNLVLAYAKNQVELQTSFYNYYKNVLGEEADAALADANAQLAAAYCINLADENVSDYSDEQIEEIYVKLITAGELVNNSFNEPQAITDLKAVIAQSGAAGMPGSKEEQKPSGEALTEGSSKVNLVNKMMDYQLRTAAQLAYSYSRFDFTDADVKEYVAEDMEKTFGYVIYDMKLSDSEKETYYNVFLERGFFDGSSLNRLGTNPVEHNLPDLTPNIKLKHADGSDESVSCSQQTLVPVASVAYALYDGKKDGYLVLRGNGTGIGFVQDDDGNSVTTQGDFFLNWNGEITSGEWYYNSSQIGFLVNDQKAGGIQYVYDLVY
ncbi:MAG: hypothetical protein ACI4EC_04375 [Lachnospiraceae bacterium]